MQPQVIFQRPTWNDHLSIVAKVAQPKATFVHCCLTFDGITVLDNAITGMAVYPLNLLKDNVVFVPVREYHVAEVPVWDDRPLHLPTLIRVVLTGDTSLMTCASWVCLMLGIYPRFNKPDKLWRYLTMTNRRFTEEAEDNEASRRLGNWQALPIDVPLAQDIAINDNSEDVLVGNGKVYTELSEDETTLS